jgi:hypothetical protein
MRKKIIRTNPGKLEQTIRTEAMKNRRRCIVCAITKEASRFSRWAIYVCEECYEKPPKQKNLKHEE